MQSIHKLRRSCHIFSLLYDDEDNYHDEGQNKCLQLWIAYIYELTQKLRLYTAKLLGRRLATIRNSVDRNSVDRIQW